ncbi:MAG TPA: MFS transporter [Pyrinomonadaceae bacterium]
MATAGGTARVGGGRGAGGMFSALAHRNFRLFWAGAFLSNTGTWTQTVAQGWLVLQLTDSASWLGVDSFMATAPALLLTLLGGVFADLVDRKRLLILTQVGAGGSALALAALLAAGVVEGPGDVWFVLALTFATGCCWAIAGPSYQAFAYDLVGREDLANAVALNSAQFQLSRVVGPVLAALTIQLFGLAGCFLVNGLSYGAIVLALSRVRFADKVEGQAVDERAGAGAHSLRDGRALWRDLVEGVRYARARPRVRLLMLCTAVVSVFGSPYLTLMPLFARNVFGWGETGLSLLMGTAGAGALAGALVIAYLGDFKRKGWLVLGAALSAGLCLMAFAWAPYAPLALAVLFVTGGSMVCFFSVSNTLLQQLVTDRMRGRVMSIWIMCFIGAMPFGNLLGGKAADMFGPRLTVLACGLSISLFVSLVGLRERRMGEI